MNLPKTYSGDQPYIFVSYSHKDSARVLPIIVLLQERGYRVWYDDGITPGSEWDDNIASRILQCSYLFAFMSEAYLQSQNCRDELNFARDKDKQRLLVFLEELDLPNGMAMRLNRLQAVYWNRFSDENEGVDKLCEAQGLDICNESGTSGRRSSSADTQRSATTSQSAYGTAQTNTYTPPTNTYTPPTYDTAPSYQQQSAVYQNVPAGRPKNKWTAFFLCLFLGVFGAHKFYEGKIIWGILYLLTGGLWLVGVFISLIIILTRPNPYYVK